MHEFIVLILPYMISILELIGIFVVFWAGIYGFYKYLQSWFTHKKFNLIDLLGHHLAMGLEFKMAAEILRTVLIQSLDELYMLGAVILLRAILSLLIHFEMSPHKKAKKEENNEIEEQVEVKKAA